MTRPPWFRWIAIAGATVLALALIAVLAIAAMPVGWLKGRVEGAIADATGAPARIGGIERAEAFSFRPTIIIRDLAIDQPRWAGPGKLLTIREARLRVPVWRALKGGFNPDTLFVTGLRAHLIRDAEGRESWQRERPDADTGGAPLGLEHIRIADARIRYADAKRDRSADVALVFDQAGLRMQGTGRVMGNPVRIAARGAPVTVGAPWRFVAQVEGAALAAKLAGQMAAPLDTQDFTARVEARGRSLKLLDALIEAGLPGTQPVRLTAAVERKPAKWIVTDLRGTIGRSQIAGNATVEKRDGRSIITGRLTSGGFDFDDLADDRGRALAAAKRARTGPRIIPDTDIDIRNMDRTDGRIEFDLRRLLWREPAPFRAARGTLTLDNLLLKVDPLTLDLTRGRATGSVTVDARGPGLPRLTVALDLTGASLATFAGDSEMTGSLRGRTRLTGSGRTIREALGRSDGHVALVARDGQLPARMASFIGLDIGRGVTVDEDRRATLRCLAFRLNVAGGRGQLSPLVIDTSRSRADVSGTLDFASERLAWSLTGAPKQSSLLRYDRPFPISGTISNPSIVPPKGSRSVGRVLGMLGKAITGNQAPLASDADCAALAARAMR